MDSLAAEVISSTGADPSPADLLESMIEGALLFEFPGADGYTYRSRFAEGVRLLTRLRQLMPKRPWLSSPDLVADYRIDARPRGFPRRDVSLDRALEDFKELPTFDSLRRALVEAFVGSRKLSDFQVRAAKAIMRQTPRDSGAVITSGTGSGKTLAFYLPVATALGPLNRIGEFWTKAVAVFPRVELLKDQFTQAHTLLAPMAPTLMKLGYRPFRLGTFFSDTPFDASISAVKEKWAPSMSRPGYRCPFLICPSPGCGGALVWLRENIEAKREILSCEQGCGREVDENHIVLTRRRAQAQPPDILFTTAESLNQRISDTYSREVFGIHPTPARRARYLLLDEIHTYGGTSGAQTAMVLRRWRHARGDGEPVRYVGLSATLEDAPRFFATLTGLFPASVTEIAPQADELEFKGKEYQLVFRGDPSSRTQLLSTTIQTCFLLSRLLDPLESQSKPSKGRYGSRVFAFTDDLDATNRLFDFLRDAEGRDILGRPDDERAPLAALRATDQPNRVLRAELGQDWAVLERLGRRLEQRLTIGRTSSQDRGVSAEADVIVATASLEVGFNDPQVGAVVQHKAPHQLANLVQRKGRAGRSPEMRPWTVTILSDFGRDRLMYQSYDRLFDPVLRPFTVPVRNLYILRMQAGFAALDWLAAANDEGGLKGSWWEALSRPAKENTRQGRQQKRAIEVINKVLIAPGSLRNDLVDYIRRALKLESIDETNEILWGSPRSLLLEVLPTLARRLETNWKLHPAVSGTVSEDLKSEGFPHPLPDFLPPNLFSDLNLPEVTVVLPPATSRDEEKVESMGIADAIGRLVPGRVTRRFAPERGKLNHWLPVPLLDGEYRLTVDSYAEENEPVASIPVKMNGELTTVVCYRPWKVRLEKVGDSAVRSTSNGRQVWRNHFLAEGEAISLATANDPQWGQAVNGFDFFLHAASAHLVVRRFALEANATVRRGDADGTEVNVATLYIDSEGNRAAVGFEQEVDAIRVTASLPTPQTLVELAAASDNLPVWKTAYFRDLVMEDPELSSVSNWFQRDRLHRVMLLVLARAAITKGANLLTVLNDLASLDIGEMLSDAASRTPPQDPSALSPNDGDAPAELEEEIRDNSADRRWEILLSEKVTQHRLLALAREMCHPDPDVFGKWLRDRIHETLGQALLAAASSVVPTHVSEGSLLLDLDRGDPYFDPGDSVEVWLTESAIGGSGAVEALARAASNEPRLLLQSLEAAIAPQDAEMTSGAMDELIDAFVGIPDIADLVRMVRGQVGHSKRVAALQDLYDVIARQGIYAESGFKVAVNHRILRSGTGPDSDALIHELVQTWRRWERELGVGLDLQTFCSLVPSHLDFGWRVRLLLDRGEHTARGDRDVEGVLYGLLWPRQWEVRARVLQSYQPFRTGGYTDPALIRELLLDPGPDPIDFGLEDWYAQFANTLATAGVTRVRIPTERRVAFSEVLFQILSTPVEVDYLQLYPVISKYQHGEGMILTFILREMF